jgi:branched-chain amino acid aminotransferase
MTADSSVSSSNAPVAQPDDIPGIAFVNGRFAPLAEATVSVFDFGFTRSDVTYDVVHVWQGRFFRLEAHLDRFFASMAALRYSLPYDRDQVRDILIEGVKRTGFRDAYVAMLCTRGRPPIGSRDMRLCENRFIAYVIPFVWLASPEKRERGLHAIISSYFRIPAGSVDPRVKNYHHLDSVRSMWEAYDRGADTAFLLDYDGNVTEGPGFNIFAVIDGKLVTPDAGVLEGVTRHSTMQIATELGLESEERRISAEELRGADEIFITSTGGGIMPVTRVDGRILGNDVPGPITGRLRDAYWRKHSDGWESTPVEYD